MISMRHRLLTGWRLGVTNVCRVLWYRIGVQLGLNPVRRLSEVTPVGPYFSSPSVELSTTFSGLKTSDSDAFMVFGCKVVSPSKNGFPLWGQSVLTGVESGNQPWWRLPDFIEGLGDIKGVWEASRFDWVLHFAKRALLGEVDAVVQLNNWLFNWCEKNPPYIGANWKCGQEASIRVMHLAVTAQMLGQSKVTAPELLALIRIHLLRIAPTIKYAIAQDNNHGTSEAAALYIGGSWLAQSVECEREKGEALNWMKLGRKWLENRARRLIESDGSFSQYSINYHRVMIDTYAMAEYWRKAEGLPKFSNLTLNRLQAATAWLGNMVSPNGADTPNLGANDGARLLPLSSANFRDVRPTVQLATALFLERRAYGPRGTWDEPLEWLGISVPEATISYQHSVQYDAGGYAVLRNPAAMALFRYPRFRFRPSQADLLHVDFWLGSLNVLRDAGSYSYNCCEPWLSYFPSSAAHNTIQFDQRDSMPRLGRFLFGAWPKARNVTGITLENGVQTVSAGYCDWKGASHHRSIDLSESGLCVSDDVENFESAAVLRWRLAPGNWVWEDGWLIGNGVRLRVQTSQPVKRCELVEGWESRYYTRKTPLPVLEVEVEQAGRLTTELRY